MLGNLDTAAVALYDDPRRRLAQILSLQLSSLAVGLLDDYSDIFDKRYRTVRGSTCRDTHITIDLDFDIGLLPVDGGSNWSKPIEEFIAELGEHVASDARMCEQLAELFGTASSAVKASLHKPTQRRLGGDTVGILTLFKFRLEEQDRSIIEVGAGTYSWHRLFLDYNAGWDEQVKGLSPDNRRRAISHVCLMKFLAKCWGIYGDADGAPSSRGYEQLIIRHASEESPLEALMSEILHVQEPRSVEVLYPIPDNKWEDVGIKPERRNVMRAFSDRAWRRLRSLAGAVLA
jgi:hypothetical protein